MKTCEKMSSFRSLGLRLAACVCLIVFVMASMAVETSAQKSKRSKKSAASKRAKAKVKRVSAEIREAEQLLHDLGYWAGPIDGRMDELSRHALIAFQKVESRERTGRLTQR